MEFYIERSTPEATSSLTELYAAEDFRTAEYTNQVESIARVVSADYGFELEDVVEFKIKDWGFYVTLESNEYGAEKILGVRPVPTEIPEHWDWDGEYSQIIEELVGSKGVALSFQKHTDNRREEWAVIDGAGYYLTADARLHQFGYRDIQAQSVSGESKDEVSHPGERWHSAINTRRDRFLVIREGITIPADSPTKFDETNIQRSLDLYKRAGTSQNI